MKTQGRRIDAVALSFADRSREELNAFVDQIGEIVTGAVTEYIADPEERKRAHEEIDSKLGALGDQFAPGSGKRK